jgi:hypothetical protein
MALLVTVLSLPWIGEGPERWCGEGRKGRGNGERQLGGKVEYALFGTSRGLIICIIAAFRFLDRTLEQKDICARLTFKEYPNFYRENVPKPRNVGGGISQRYERVCPRKRDTQIWKRKEKKMEIFHYKEYHVAIDSVGVVCPIPFLNPLTKLRIGSNSQSSAPDGVSTCVLARVRGLVSESSSSGSRCRFFAPPDRAAGSTAVASVEAIENEGRFSNFSERLGLTSETLVVAP